MPASNQLTLPGYIYNRNGRLAGHEWKLFEATCSEQIGPNSMLPRVHGGTNQAGRGHRPVAPARRGAIPASVDRKPSTARDLGGRKLLRRSVRTTAARDTPNRRATPRTARSASRSPPPE